ncbi:response regulator [Myxococcota bacterium]|nr:response regulator [Myxococcota bacterium]MBU1535690.1 response regulator [Myxococcota bacterium]
MARILLIDDDFQIRLMLRMTFEEAGYTVEVAENGKEGIAKCAAFDPQVIITDIIMPEMDGTETIMKLSKSHPNTKIIAISGGGRNSPEGYLFVAKQLGADMTFFKPIDRSKLLEAVAQLIPGEISQS